LEQKLADLKQQQMQTRAENKRLIKVTSRPLFFPGIFFGGGGGIPPPPKGLTVFPKDWQIVCSKSFFGGRDNELPLYHGNVLFIGQ